MYKSKLTQIESLKKHEKNYNINCIFEIFHFSNSLHKSTNDTNLYVFYLPTKYSESKMGKLYWHHVSESYKEKVLYFYSNL